MTIIVLCILGIATIGCIAGAVQEFKESDNLGMRIYVILGVIAGLLLVIGGFISYFTHWF
jgi:hypothetical protein